MHEEKNTEETESKGLFLLLLFLCLSWNPASILPSQNNVQFMRQAEGHAL